MRKALPDIQWDMYYLTFPIIVFAIGFLTPSIALPLTALIVAALLFSTPSPGVAPSYPRSATYIPLVFAIGILALLGFPNGPYTWDWIKHWAILNELASRPWPVIVPQDGSDGYLRYYMGAYIIPAWFHKILPSLDIPTLYGIWLFIGITLLFRNICRLGTTPRECFIAASLALIMGGADYLMERTLYSTLIATSLPWFGLHSEDWGILLGERLEFSSMLTSLIWTPNQAIPTCLVTCILLSANRGKPLSHAFLAYGALTFWSPYGAIGLLPLISVITLKRYHTLWHGKTLLALLAGVSIAGVIAIYLSTDIPQNGGCFTCIWDNAKHAHVLILFLCVELLCFLMILEKRLWSDRCCITALLTLALLPFMHGETSDMVMRGATGPLFLLSLYSIEEILKHRDTGLRIAQIVAISICAVAAANEAWYVHTKGRSYLAISQEKYPDLRPSWKFTFAEHERYTAQDFLALCGQHYRHQYFSSIPPRLVRESVLPAHRP